MFLGLYGLFEAIIYKTVEKFIKIHCDPSKVTTENVTKSGQIEGLSNFG